MPQEVFWTAQPEQTYQAGPFELKDETLEKGFCEICKKGFTVVKRLKFHLEKVYAKQSNEKALVRYNMIKSYYYNSCDSLCVTKFIS